MLDVGIVTSRNHDQVHDVDTVQPHHITKNESLSLKSRDRLSVTMTHTQNTQICKPDFSMFVQLDRI